MRARIPDAKSLLFQWALKGSPPKAVLIAALAVFSCPALAGTFTWSGSCGPQNNRWDAQVQAGECSIGQPRYVNNWGLATCHPTFPGQPNSDDDVLIGAGWTTVMYPHYSVRSLVCAGSVTLAANLTTSEPVVIHGQLRYGGGGTVAPTVLTVMPGATMEVYSGGFADGGAVVNQGLCTHASPTGFVLSNGAVFHNEGTIEAREDSAFTGTGGTLTNSGTFRRLDSSGIFQISSLHFENTGTLDVQTGTLSVSCCDGFSTGPITIADEATLRFGDCTSDFTLRAGTTVTGNGWLEQANGILRVVPDLTVSKLKVLHGTLDHADRITCTQGLELAGAVISGAGELVIPPQASFTMPDNWGVPAQLVNHTLSNHGSITWGGVSGITLTSGSVLNNAGTMTTSPSWFWAGTFPLPVVNNTGTLRCPGGGSISNVTFNNSGLVDIQSGVLAINPFNQTAGETRVAAGAGLSGAGNPIEIGGGNFTGGGSVTNSAVVNTGGTVAPGPTAGRLSFNSGYTQGAGGTLDIEIGGTAAGSSYDQLAVMENAPTSLDGTLAISLIAGFVPDSGDTFRIVSTIFMPTGRFARVTGLAIDSTRRFIVDYSSAGVTLSVAPKVRPDLDADGDVDDEDRDNLVSCARGPEIPYGPGCLEQDLDDDGDVDHDDFGIFQRCYSGPDRSSPLNCDQ